jgi:zinc and cadmium transporter
MDALLLTLGSTFLVSLISFVGVVTLAIKSRLLNKILLILVSFSAGALMGGAFLHLLPEAIETATDVNILLYVLVGFVIFFLLEKILYWRHCHKEKCTVHAFTYLNLIGDGIHNFIDGLVIAASFVTNVQLGIATTLAITSHEIPQEIGDFGVLIYGGMNKMRALFLNFLSALTAVIGGVIGYFVSSYAGQFTIFLLPFAAGGFIYISSSDLIPEIRNMESLKKSMMTFAVFLIGILLMWTTKTFFG